MNITVNEHDYDIGKLDARAQLKVMLKLAPVFVSMQPLLVKISERLKEARVAVDAAKGDLPDMAGMDVMGSLEPLLEALGHVPEADIDYIIDMCLSVVKRKDRGDSWAPMMHQGVQMYRDINLPDLLRIVGAVIWHNLSGFTSGNQPTSPVPVPQSGRLRKVG